jgi:hypothetical protein
VGAHVHEEVLGARELVDGGEYSLRRVADGGQLRVRGDEVEQLGFAAVIALKFGSANLNVYSS